MFSCRGCHKTDLRLEQMKKEKSLLINNRGICKPCHSVYNKTNARIKKAERSPDDFLSCNTCNEIFSKYQVCRPLIKTRVFKKLKVECPFCKSEEIERY